MSAKPVFWCLSRPAFNVSPSWDERAGRRNERTTCPADPAHNSSGKRLGDLHLVLPNSVLEDFLWTWLSDCLVQNRVLDGFRFQEFSGFENRPAHVRWEHSSDNPLPKLWELEVTGWAGMARPESGIRRLERCLVCGRQVYTGFTKPEFLIDEKQWDGTDFFTVWPMSRRVFVTDRVASFVRSQNLTGVDVVNVRDLSFPKHVKTISPLPLRFHFSEERARKLGGSLDIY